MYNFLLVTAFALTVFIPVFIGIRDRTNDD
jgi:hypothetical protein